MDQIVCKRCGGGEWVKNGIVRGKQRYRCRSCGCNFTVTPRRGKPEAAKALAVLLYSMGKASYGWIGKLLGVSGVAVYKWVRRTGEGLPPPELREEIQEMELDEMWHFLQSKKTSAGCGKPMIVAHDDVWPGLSVVVILLPSENYGKRSRAATAPISRTTGRATRR